MIFSCLRTNLTFRARHQNNPIGDGGARLLIEALVSDANVQTILGTIDAARASGKKAK